MASIPFTPIPGKTYTNRNGYEYLCIRLVETGTPRFRTRAAIMESVTNGWTMTTHGLQQYEDGTIEWNYSTDGHFKGGRLRS